MRIILLNGLTVNGVEGLKKLRPTPDAYAIIADTISSEKLFKKVKFKKNEAMGGSLKYFLNSTMMGSKSYYKPI